MAYNGKILVVDLSGPEWHEERIPESLLRMLPGGKALALHFLLKGQEPGLRWDEPENQVVFVPGLLTGLRFPGVPRYTVASVSPSGNGFGQSESGGYVGPALKTAGFDGIVVRGRARAPVYLLVSPDGVRVKDASALWGMSTIATEEAIRRAEGDPALRVLSIGPAGENLVRYACVINDTDHAAGRTGMGAVMGRKNLKAVAVRPGKPVEGHDPAACAAIRARYLSSYMSHQPTVGLNRWGTSAGISAMSRTGLLPTRNFSAGAFERADDLDGSTLERFITGRTACFGCPVACKKRVDARAAGVDHDLAAGAPEYETIAAFGSNCGVGDYGYVLRAQEMCNLASLDTISAGNCVAFAMECYERGLITASDNGGVPLDFGNGEAMLLLLDDIVHRRGLGDVLADGVEAASRAIPGSEGFAMHVNGIEVPMHEARGKGLVAVGYLLSDHGADHMIVPHDTAFSVEDSPALRGVEPLGIRGSLEAPGLRDEKLARFTTLDMYWSGLQNLGGCFFAIQPRGALGIEDLCSLTAAATGWAFNVHSLLAAGERAVNMGRLFALRQKGGGLATALPKRFYEQQSPGGAVLQGIDRDAFDAFVAAVYQARGWDSRGVPTRGKLLELGLKDYLDPGD